MINVTNCKFGAKKKYVKMIFIKQEMFEPFAHHILALCVFVEQS